MDDIVLKAMMRWPNVPSVYGWLTLDRRGRWLIKGDPISNPTLNAFIGRNYMVNSTGQWYFQNGPQQVFVALEYTPYIHRIWCKTDDSLMGETHTGQSINRALHCWIDDAGGLLLDCEHGIGCVEPQSLQTVANALTGKEGSPLAAGAIEALLDGDERTASSSRLRWGPDLVPIGLIRCEEVPKHFHFDRFPEPPIAGVEDC